MNDGELRTAFLARFGREARIARAPGRVNLIGEHTDYNDGWVLPVAIDLTTRVAFAPTGGASLMVRSSAAPGEDVELPLGRSDARRRGQWSDYVEGVLRALEADGLAPPAAGLLIDSDLPLGAGLGSSAALEVAVAHALLALAGARVVPAGVARLCQRAENDFVGARCGIMDQAIACLGRAEHALLLDCRSGTTNHVPLPASLEIVVASSGVRHVLADGEYNRRRAECEEVVARLSAGGLSIRALRDVTLDDLDRVRAWLGEPLYRRARHVITENARVLEFAALLRADDPSGLGRLLRESHASLRDDYEVSCDELDLLVQQATGLPGLVGARMTGGGFGGCTVNLVRAGGGASFARSLGEACARAGGLVIDTWCTRAVGGVRVDAS